MFQPSQRYDRREGKDENELGRDIESRNAERTESSESWKIS